MDKNIIKKYIYTDQKQTLMKNLLKDTENVRHIFITFENTKDPKIDGLSIFTANKIKT